MTPNFSELSPGEALRKSAEAFSVKDFTAAETIAIAGAEQWTSDARFFAQAAISAIHRGAFAEAGKLARTAIALEPWLLRHWHLLGSALAAEGRDGDARDVYSRILSLQPHDARAAGALGHLRGSPRSAKISLLVRTASAQPRLSVCMIVKNEAARLGRCLDSLQGVFDELVIVDTGSVDETKTIAASYGARLIESAWHDDFSRARNEALDAATGDWILSIDADEVLVSQHELRNAIAQETAGAITVQIDEILDGGRRYLERATRLFRRHPGVRFSGRIHEQVGPALQACGFRAVASAVTLHHDGYQQAIVKSTKKLERNERLLVQEIASDPGDAYWRYQLGKNYMMAGTYSEALACFAAARDLLPLETSPFMHDLFVSELRLLVSTRAYELALTVSQLASNRFPTSPDVAFFVGQCLLELGRYGEARAAFETVVRMRLWCCDPSLPALASEALRLISCGPVPHADLSEQAALDLLIPSLREGMCLVDVADGLSLFSAAFERAVGARGRVYALAVDVRIDGLNLDRCELLRIESSATRVIAGARQTIRRHKPVLFIRHETLHGSPELLQLLSNEGYEVFWHISSHLAGLQPHAHLLCVAKGVKVNGLLPVCGMDDDWQKALSRMQSAQVRAS